MKQNAIFKNIIIKLPHCEEGVKGAGRVMCFLRPDFL